MNNRIISLLLLAMALTSCDEFLSERPSKSSDIVPSTYEDMETIMAGMWRSDCVSYNLVYGGGDVALDAAFEAARPGAYHIEAVEGATWERKDNGTNTDYMWLYRHQNIFRSNMVLTSLDKLENVSEADLQRLRSEACWRRAYSYMELLNLYTLPYCESNLQEPGLVKCESPSFNYSLERMSLADTYDFIEKDILEGLKIDEDLTKRVGRGSPYRVTKASANALAARFYLIKQDYSEAEKYAKAALASYGEDKVLNYNDIGFSTTVDAGTIEIDGKTVSYEVHYPATAYGYDVINSWTENYFIGSSEGTYSSGVSTDNLVSNSLVGCFDQDGKKEDDARWKYFYVKNYCYLNGYTVDLPYFMRPQEYTISVPEMMLTVAECEARAGDYKEALKYVNRLRAKRIDPSGNVNLSASSKDAAIAIVLRERRRETGPHNRLFDVRRYNSNDYSADDVTITQKFFSFTHSGVDQTSALVTYTLAPGDRKIASQIPECDILSSDGELKQNTY